MKGQANSDVPSCVCGMHNAVKVACTTLCKPRAQRYEGRVHNVVKAVCITLCMPHATGYVGSLLREEHNDIVNVRKKGKR